MGGNEILQAVTGIWTVATIYITGEKYKHALLFKVPQYMLWFLYGLQQQDKMIWVVQLFAIAFSLHGWNNWRKDKKWVQK